MEREGEAEEDYRHWQDEVFEARCTQVLERLPDWRTKRREGTGEALGSSGIE